MMIKINKMIILFLMLVLSLISTPRMGLADKLVISSEAWEKATNEDGTGAYFDLLRRIYEPLGYQLEFHTTLYKRSVNNTMKGRSDAWIGSYAKEVKNANYPHNYFDMDSVEALCRKGTLSGKDPVRALTDKKLAWIIGYEYQQYLPADTHFMELPNRDSVFALLDKGRIDCYLDAAMEMETAIKGHPKYQLEYQRYKLVYLPLYLGFSPNAKGKMLARIFDERFPALFKSGELEKIYAHWHVPFYKDQFRLPKPEESAEIKK